MPVKPLSDEEFEKFDQSSYWTDGTEIPRLVATVKADRTALEASRQREEALRECLDKFARHKDCCPVLHGWPAGKCNCGLCAALSTPTPPSRLVEVKPFNVNEDVWVCLTEYGVTVYRNHYAEVEKQLRRPCGVAKAGEWKSFQLWDLMNIFGPHMRLGFSTVPFVENDICFKKPDGAK